MATDLQGAALKVFGWFPYLQGRFESILIPATRRSRLAGLGRDESMAHRAAVTAASGSIRPGPVIQADREILSKPVTARVSLGTRDHL